MRLQISVLVCGHLRPAKPKGHLHLRVSEGKSVRASWTFYVTHDFFSRKYRNPFSKKRGESVRERASLAHTPENSKVVLAVGMAGSRSSSHVILSWLCFLL